MLGLIGKKVGMTQIFSETGELVSATVIRVGPCTVVQKKTLENDGYNALQLGFETARPKRMPRALRGHFEKRGLALFTHLKEFRTDAIENFSVGDELRVAAFRVGERVKVMGTTKGRGFQGVIKRHGKHGGPASHGSDFHRRPGSIGMRTWPSRVPKNMRLPGHMGDVRVTIQGLEVVGVRPEEDVILIRGAVPGARDGLVIITPDREDFDARPELRGTKGPSADEEVVTSTADEHEAASSQTKE